MPSILQKEHCRFSLPVDVSACDINLFGTLSPCATLRYMDRGRVEAIEAHARDTSDESWLTSYVVNVYKIEIKTHGPANIYRPIEVLTGIRKSSSHRATFDQLLVSADGNVITEAAIEILFLDLKRELATTPEQMPGRPDYQPASILSPEAHPIPFSKTEHFAYTHPLRVYYEDTDAQGIVYHVSYLRFFERALFPLLSSNLMAVRPRITRQSIRYLNSSRLGDRLEVKMGGRIINDHQVLLDVRIYSVATGKLATDAIVEMDFIDENKNRHPIPLSIKGICQTHP